MINLLYVMGMKFCNINAAKRDIKIIGKSLGFIFSGTDISRTATIRATVDANIRSDFIIIIMRK